MTYKSHHYCFSKEEQIRTDHKALIAIFKKHVAMLLQRLECILLKIHYKINMIYKLGPDLYIADLLSIQLANK